MILKNSYCVLLLFMASCAFFVLPFICVCVCRSWVCEECGAALSTLKALQVHGLIHAGPASKQQACTMCNKTFRHRNTLTKEQFNNLKWNVVAEAKCGG